MDGGKSCTGSCASCRLTVTQVWHGFRVWYLRHRGHRSSGRLFTSDLDGWALSARPGHGDSQLRSAQLRCGNGLSQVSMHDMWHLDRRLNILRYRGLLTGLYQACFFAGTISTTWLEFGLSYLPPDSVVAWRLPLGLQTVPSLILLSGVYWIPETPRWVKESASLVSMLT